MYQIETYRLRLVKLVLSRYYVPMNEEIFNLIERLANLIRQESRSEGMSLGLQPIQQEALYYLSVCNRYSDNPIAVTEYLGLTKGTVSQTLKVLESKNLIEKYKDKNDKRVTHLKITAEGQAHIDQTSPPPKLKQALELGQYSDTEALKKSLTQLLTNYQNATGRTGFGVCRQCKHNQSTKEGFVCGLTKENLASDETLLICREYDTKV